MNLNKRIKALATLGKFFAQYTQENIEDKEFIPFQEELDHTIFTAIQHNSWFTKEDIYYNLKQWAKNLTQENLENWANSYPLDQIGGKTIAIIMAGNIPLVGFHDFICVLISGHKALVKLSSKDKHLLPLMAKFLTKMEKDYANQIAFTDAKLTHFDAVIATGSNNTARYFEYYFSEKPHIIRKNRNSVAVITGKETQEELAPLGDDIFRYYGLGCRNVSKIFVPKDYDFKTFFESIFPWNPIINSHKYANNYDYNKAVYLMSEFKLLENGFLILKEDAAYASPIACLFYAYYDDLESLQQKLMEDREQIQCVVASQPEISDLSFGETQQPSLTDYADGVDILDFLSKI